MTRTSSPSILSSQTTLIGLLVVSFFSQGCLFAWTILAGEAPLSGSSFAAQVREIALKSVWLGKGMGLPSLPVPKSTMPSKADPRQHARPLNVYRTSSAAALASDVVPPPSSAGGVAVASSSSDSFQTNTLDEKESTSSSVTGLNSDANFATTSQVSSQRLVYMPPSVLNGVLIPGAFVSEDQMRKSQKENTLIAKLKMGINFLPSLFGNPTRKSPSTHKPVRSPYARNFQVLGLCFGRVLPKGTRDALWIWWNSQGKLPWELLVGSLLWLAVGLGAPFVVCKAFSPSLGGDSGVSALALVVVPVLADTLTLAHTVAAFEGPLLGSSTWLSPLPTLFRLVSFSLLAPVIFTACLGLLPTHLHLWSPTLAALESSLIAFTGDGSVGLNGSTATSLLLLSWPFAQSWVVYPLVSTGKTTGFLIAFVLVPFLAPCLLFLLARGVFQGIRSCLSLRSFIGLRRSGAIKKGGASSKRGGGFNGRNFNVAGTAVQANDLPVMGVLPAAEDPSTDPRDLLRSNTQSALTALPALFTFLSCSTTAAALAGVLQDVGARDWMLGTNGVTLEVFSKSAPATIDSALLMYESTLSSGFGSIASTLRLANLTSVQVGLAQGLAQHWGNTAAKLTPLASSAVAAASVIFASCAVTQVISLIGTVFRARKTDCGVISPTGTARLNRYMSSLCLPHVVSSGRNLACGLALAVSFTLDVLPIASTPTFIRASIAAAFAFHALFFHLLTAAFATRSLFLDLSQWLVFHAACGGLDALSFTSGGVGQAFKKEPHHTSTACLATARLPSVDLTPPTSLTLAQTNHLARLHSLFTFLPYVTLIQALGVALGFQTRHSAQSLIAGYVGLPFSIYKSDSTFVATNETSSLHMLPSNRNVLKMGRPQREDAKSFGQDQPRKPQHVVFIEVDKSGEGFGKDELKEDGVVVFSSSSLSATQPVTPRLKIKFDGNHLPPILAECGLSLTSSNGPAAALNKSQPVLVPIPDPSGCAPFILVPLLNEGGECTFNGKGPSLSHNPVE